ncbi:ArnT family glycosyltransferase [Rhizobium sp.]
MLARLMRDPGAVYTLLAIYLAVNVAVRLLSPHSLALDEAQQLYFAQWLAPGYDDQPPFYNWLQYGVVQVLGNSVPALSLLKNALLLCCFLLVGLAARLTMRNRALEIMAVLGLLLQPQIVFEAQRDLTHSVASIFASALFVASAFWALRQGNILAYAMTGIAIGVGVLSKYNVVLLPLLFAIAALFEPTFRARLLNWRIVVTALFAAAVVYPHARWFFDNIDLATTQTIGKLTQAVAGDRFSQIVAGLFSLVIALFVYAAPTVLAYWIAFGRRFQESWRASSPWSRILGRAFVLLVVALVLMIVFGGVSTVKQRWLMPYFVMLPLYLSLKLDALNQTIGNATSRFGWIILPVAIIVPIVLLARIPMAQYLGRYEKLNVPYDTAVAEILKSGQQAPALILASDMQLGGNIRMQAQDIPVVVPGFADFAQRSPADPQRPILLVWRNKGEADAPMQDELRGLLASELGSDAAALQPQDIAKPYHYGKPGDAYHFQYAWVYSPAPDTE